jgi:hypothetical protein
VPVLIIMIVMWSGWATTVWWPGLSTPGVTHGDAHCAGDVRCVNEIVLLVIIVYRQY